MLCSGMFLNRCVSLTEGESARFRCRFEGQPLPDVTWYYNEVPIKSSAKYRVRDDWYDYELNMPQVMPDMSGLYKVRATNKFGSVESFAELDVKGKDEVFLTNM